MAPFWQCQRHPIPIASLEGSSESERPQAAGGCRRRKPRLSTCAGSLVCFLGVWCFRIVLRARAAFCVFVPVFVTPASIFWTPAPHNSSWDPHALHQLGLCMLERTVTNLLVRLLIEGTKKGAEVSRTRARSIGQATGAEGFL